MKKLNFRKIANLLIAGIFLVNSICYGLDLSCDKATLATPSIFQKSSPTQDSAEFKESILSDIKFLTATFSIVSHFLVDGKTKHTLVKTMRDEFRNNKEFLKGIDLENVRREKNIVYIPFEIKKRQYEARICEKEKFETLDESHSEWGVSERFGVQIVPVIEQTEAETYTEAKVRELIKEGKTTILADDGEEFIFLLEPEKDMDKHAFTIIVQNRSRYVGFVDIFRNYGDYSFDSTYSSFKEDALLVKPEYGRKYKHIGQSLVSFALGVVRSNEYENFFARPVRMGKESFFKRIGFQQNPDNLRKFSFDLTSQPLPIIGIVNKKNKIEQNMVSIHKINMDLFPPVENGKTLWHVIPEEIIPRSIRANFVNMVSDINRNYPDLREKIKIVTERQDLNIVVAGLASDPNNIVDAAVADIKDLEKLPEGVRALVFEGELGDFRQLEGILAALRALQQDNTKAIIALYEILTGMPFSGSEEEILNRIEDPRRLADILIFNLKPIEVEDYEELNRNLLEFIQSSA